MSKLHHVLGVDDDAGQLTAIERICESLGYHFTGVRNVEAALAALATQSFCAVVSDLCVPFGAELPRIETGLNFIDRLRDQSQGALPIIAMSGHGEDHRYCTEAVQRGARDFSKKPIDEDWESLDRKLKRWIKECCVDRHPRCPNTPTGSGKGRRAKSAGAAPRDPSGPRVVFDGRVDGRLARLIVDGDPCAIRPLSFKILCKLWIHKRRGGEGWVHETDLHRAANMPRVMGEVQQDLKKRAGLEDVIEGDGRKNYRLKLPVANFSVDREAMKSRHSQLLELLDDR